MDPKVGWEIYEKAGAAALFLFMFLGTVYLFINDLKEQRRAAIESTKEVVKALETSSTATHQCAEAVKEVKATLATSDQHTTELLAFLKGRDSVS